MAPIDTPVTSSFHEKPYRLIPLSCWSQRSSLSRNLPNVLESLVAINTLNSPHDWLVTSLQVSQYLRPYTRILFIKTEFDLDPPKYFFTGKGPPV